MTQPTCHEHIFDRATWKCKYCNTAFASLASAIPRQTTEALMRAWFAGTDYEPPPATQFLCRELDDIRQQIARAQRQLGMLGLPEPPTDAHCCCGNVAVAWREGFPVCERHKAHSATAAEGVHVHKKVFSNTVMPTYPAKRNWICSECLEEDTDSERARQKGPTYEELVAKKRERIGG
jgi:hypothetical protein